MSSSFFIINPRAGNGRATRFWEDVRRKALLTSPGSSFAFTERPGHASELCLAALRDGADMVVAVGGDGTFCETLEGMMSAPEDVRERSAIAALPAGSGCDLARHLGCSRDPGSLLAMLSEGRTRAIDVGRLRYAREDGSRGERHFINIAAFGLAGDVAHHIKGMGKPLGGTVSYAVSSLVSILGARAREMRLRADGRELRGRFHLGVLANTSSMGGGMLVAPGTKDDDGVMDLILVSDMSRLSLVKKLPLLYRGEHLGTAGVEQIALRRLEAESDETVYLNIDGEADGMLPANFEVLPKAVRVLVPSGG